jgi:hypothetical protein
MPPTRFSKPTWPRLSEAGSIQARTALIATWRALASRAVPLEAAPATSHRTGLSARRVVAMEADI